MTTAMLQEARTRRLSELDEEITALRGKIQRTFADESLLLRTQGNISDVEILELAQERARLESALFNLTKEKGELQ